MPIKNLIFDLGGVLYEIDYQRVTNKLKALSPNLHFSQLKQDPIFDDFEIGKISPQQFRDGIRSLTQIPDLQDNQIDAIWNSMLIGLFPRRIELIQKLSQKYPIVLLSNANPIHYDYIIKECQPLFASMQKVFFSFEMGMRKPHKEIFEQVLKTMNFQPDETLFIEDTIIHIEGAQKLGIQTLHLTQPLTLEEQLAEILS
ncbi:MAG: hydrolase [Bacteroidia bacterium]|nr:MAG: hydrolase [Bacteroidia bacterium]